MSYTTRETYDFILKQTNDPIVEWKTCTVSGQIFPITQSDLDFYDKVSPTFNGQKYQIPTPTLCPEERQRRRISFRNERKLYKRKCDFSGKEIISIYSPDKPFKVYDQKIWRGDERNPMDYGRDFDFSKTFTENFRELMLNVPRLSMANRGHHNSDYCSHTSNCTNCYLIFGSSESQDSMYGSRILSSSTCIDGYDINYSECVFESVDIYHSSFIFYSVDLENCSFCFGCVGLRNKQYCIYNQQYTKEQRMVTVKNLKYDKGKLPLENYLRKHPTEENVFQSTFVMNSKEILFSKDIYDCEKMKYCSDCYNGCADCMDCFSLYGPVNLCYECYAIGVGCYQGIALSDCYPFSSVFYCDMCYGCSNCLGCVGLKNQSYCIFNKQYPPSEYQVVLGKILAHMQETWEWGEFLHPSLSSFAYNETVANEYFPSTQQEAEKAGYYWTFYEAPQPTADKIIQGKDLPASIEEVNDDILQSVIACEITGKLFRIEAKELAFYRKHHLPLPHRHPDQRHWERMQLRNAW